MEAASREQALTPPQRKAWTDREGQVTSNRNWRRSCFKKRLRDSDGYVGMGVARAVVKLHKPMVRNRNERFKIMRKVAWAANIQSVKDLLEGTPQSSSALQGATVQAETAREARPRVKLTPRTAPRAAKVTHEKA